MAIIYNTASTLNGFIADKDNSLQWLFNIPDSDTASEDFGNFLANVGTIVMGSTTYEWLLKDLHLINNPHKWTEVYGDRSTWVFSSRNLATPEGIPVNVVNGDVADVLPAILEKTPENTDIWIVGGGDLAGQFFDAGALDRIILTMAPVFLDEGQPAMPRRIESDRLRTVNVREVGQFTEITLETI
ncbi:hypothetical protein CDES_03690 [Corynebacterium deserti GIMN1.010]|uniref:Bacterial bifunctional deaminase-reductase C-terminal domain-containing protein n=1 Tax=Corynebacterium deserti GIMN1.010 TaxID=931089 RepID=A0A0M4CEV3_9CORY|nr:dihydrofolate reductase family protein [Corynebacterium deserti]ALC05190.1 hypothetical protein CDES_03690 [Corynebacterium deserti GIMN1.010]